MKKRGKEFKRLVKRLEDQNTTNFNVFRGPNWNDSTPEERAKAINDSMDAVEDGDFVEIKNLDEPNWFPMPRLSTDDFMSRPRNFNYYKWRVLNRLHSYAWKFDRWQTWKVHKVRRFFNKDYNKKI